MDSQATKPTEPTPGLGRVAIPDERDKNYPMQAAMPRAVDLPRFRHWPTFYPPLDQGSTSQCVSYSIAGALMASPVRHRRDQFTANYLQDRYLWAQDNDEWAGREPSYYGTSVNAGCKAYRDAGFIESWHHAQSMSDCEQWLLLERPLVIGVAWYDSFYNPDPKTGVIRITPNARIVGGHALFVPGLNYERGLYRPQNSWGLWGQFGKCWIEAETLERLLFREQGDAVGILENPVPQL